MDLCDCRGSEFHPHEPHQWLFCRAPIHITDPDLIELLRKPPRPLKVHRHIPVARIEEE